MRVTVSDVVSPSYFPLTAAVEPDVARGYTFPALVARDAPFFDPTVSPDAIDGACRFAQSIGQLTAPLPYEQIVATQFQHLWTAARGIPQR
jgi:hypothetical protein